MSIEEIQKGHLLHISNYAFQDGGNSKSKFCIVLNVNGNETYIIHCLTTTQNKKLFPELHFGCSVSGNIPYFFIPKGQDLKGELGFTFKQNTLIFFQNNIRKESIVSFKDYCASGQISIKEKLSDLFLKRLIKCLLKSDFVPMNLIEELKTIKESL